MFLYTLKEQRKYTIMIMGQIRTQYMPFVSFSKMLQKDLFIHLRGRIYSKAKVDIFLLGLCLELTETTIAGQVYV